MTNTKRKYLCVRDISLQIVSFKKEYLQELAFKIKQNKRLNPEEEKKNSIIESYFFQNKGKAAFVEQRLAIHLTRKINYN